MIKYAINIISVNAWVDLQAESCIKCAQNWITFTGKHSTCYLRLWSVLSYNLY